MSERYFYLRKAGRITGPFEAARLLAGARHGRIGAEDEISRDKREWRRVAEVPWLKPESAAEPPLFAEPEIRMPEPEAQAEAAIPPVAAPAAVSPVLPVEPEEEWEPPEIDPAEAPSARRLVGDALSLIWNTTDNLLKIPERYGVSGTVWSGVTAWLGSMAMIMAAIAAFGRSYRFWVHAAAGCRTVGGNGGVPDCGRAGRKRGSVAFRLADLRGRSAEFQRRVRDYIGDGGVDGGVEVPDLL